jgi:methylthioribose-1-phosphate isomerase
MSFNSKIKTIEWFNDTSRMINQTILPSEFKTVDVKTLEEMYDAIKNMLGAIELSKTIKDKEIFLKELNKKAQYLKSSRPTAVNLTWAIDKQIQLAVSVQGDIQNIVQALRENAIKLENEDIEINKKMGDYGASVVPLGATILTHCNAGALATVGYGTALGVIRSAFAKDPTIKVFADETRPRQQGARLTTWELTQDGIPTTLITDGMCSYFMSKGMINMVVVGADRIAANGDTANKIGTYTVAIAAKYHNIPFYIAAPLSTIDTTIKSGDEIPIEERNHEEVTHINGDWICAKEVNIINPSFDVTPHELITGIITEKGILKPNFETSIKEAFSQK